MWGRLIERMHIRRVVPAYTENVPAYKMTDVELAMIVEILREWQYKSNRGMDRPMIGTHRDAAIDDVCSRLKLSRENAGEALAILSARHAIHCKINALDAGRIEEIQITANSFRFMQETLSTEREQRRNRFLSYAAIIISVLALLVDFGDSWLHGGDAVSMQPSESIQPLQSPQPEQPEASFAVATSASVPDCASAASGTSTLSAFPIPVQPYRTVPIPEGLASASSDLQQLAEPSLPDMALALE